MAELFDLAISWDWEYDREFIAVVERELHIRSLKFFSISHHNTHEVVRKIQNRQLVFEAYLDRAAETDENFAAVARAIRKTPARLVNPPEAVHHAADKATMHLEFLTRGIHVPFTIIISPYAKKKDVELSLTDLAHLGRPFIIKPANTTGGGTGVILGAETLKDVIESRQHHKNDKYLLQEKVEPRTLDGHRGWFRVFWILGQVLPCWWNDLTHIYAPVTSHQLRKHHLRPLLTVTKKIHDVCDLDFFSTEIAITPAGQFVVVDYVNEICDMRPQSMYVDGVPDDVVKAIGRQIARLLQSTAR
jgi:hypothetical protein